MGSPLFRCRGPSRTLHRFREISELRFRYLRQAKATQKTNHSRNHFNTRNLPTPRESRALRHIACNPKETRVRSRPRRTPTGPSSPGMMGRREIIREAVVSFAGSPAEKEVDRMPSLRVHPPSKLTHPLTRRDRFRRFIRNVTARGATIEFGVARRKESELLGYWPRGAGR